MREKGALGGAYMRIGAIRLIPGMDVFPPFEFSMVVFMGGIILCTAEDPFGPTVGLVLKPL